MKKNVQPLGKNVLVKLRKAEKKTQSGIVLPDTVSEERPQEAEVIAVGDSEKINKAVKKGAIVLFKKYSGTEIEIEKEDYMILDGSEDILAIVE